MKKLFVFLSVVFAASFSGFAQYQVGDLMEKDDIPCVVIKVDEEGEHGLVMTLTGNCIATKALAKMVEAGEVKIDSTKMGNLFYMYKIANQSWKKVKEWTKSTYLPAAKEHLTAVADKMTGSGKENFEYIKKYCSENNVSMADVFPEHAWAESLGEGWFLAGDDELAEYAFVISEGLGVKEKQKNTEIYPIKYMSLREQCAQTGGFNGASVVVPFAIWSSTMEPGKRHYLQTAYQTQGVLYTKAWTEINKGGDLSRIGHGVLSLCAVSEF